MTPIRYLAEVAEEMTKKVVIATSPEVILRFAARRLRAIMVVYTVKGGEQFLRWRNFTSETALAFFDSRGGFIQAPFTSVW